MNTEQGSGPSNPAPSTTMDRLLAVWEKLTWGRLALAVFAAASYIFLYVIWEQRSAVFITITGNVAAMVSMAVGFGLLLICGVAVMVVKVFDTKNAETIKVLTERVAAQERETDRLQKLLTTSVAEERRQCDERMREMRELHEERMNEMRSYFDKLVAAKGK